MPKPTFMSSTHVEAMNEILRGAPEVLEASRRLDRAYAVHYDLSDGPDGGTVHWTMLFDPHRGVRVGLEEPSGPDLALVGDWTLAIRAAAAQRRGEEFDPGFEVRGDPSVMDEVGQAYAAAQAAASIDVTFPELSGASPDVRATPTYRAVAEHLRRLHEPAFGRPHTLLDVDVTADGEQVTATGAVFDELHGVPRTAIYSCRDGELHPLTAASGSSRHGRWAPDGSALAFLSDRSEAGVFQLYLLPAGVSEAEPAAAVPGTVEYAHWSPDGRQILLGVAELGADLAGGQGSGTTTSGATEERPGWMPEVESGQDVGWRSLWMLSIDTGAVTQVSPAGMNCWEAGWCGNDRVVTVASDRPSEDSWYVARLVLLDLTAETHRELLRSDSQLGLPAGSPDGRQVAVLQAICSDRWVVAGDLTLVDADSGDSRKIDTSAVDVTGLQWIDGARLGYVGQRHLNSVAGILDTTTDDHRELFDTDRGCGGAWFYPQGAFTAAGTIVRVEDAYDLPPQITRTDAQGSAVFASIAHPGTDYLTSVAGEAQALSWTAPDGLEIEGIVCVPPGPGPHPLVVNLHGGPVWAFRKTWSLTYNWVPLLVSRGYAVLNPNPRGSGGRGQEFARHVVGDMGGADTGDLLAGIDRLVDQGLADPDRVGLIGGSYGGFMSSWLVTQDRRFAAAVPISPVTDWYSQSFTSNIAGWGLNFLDGDLEHPGGHAHTRSPVLQASAVRTPCLNVAGDLDRCTPPTQAREFHQALCAHGVESVLAIYPQEGHGVRAFPAQTDFLTRAVSWFETHMPPRGARPTSTTGEP